ncbi:MAG: hypothetical protein M1827_006589 [Pycnora praestabilis]|nr:MAG: hypothetical protein M1827_006589 [Pycnora praestabilis]
MTTETTAKRWFDNGDTFDAPQHDYAIVGRYAGEIQEQVDGQGMRQHPELKNFDDFFHYIKEVDGYWFGQPRILVYADVDGTNEHKKTVLRFQKTPRVVRPMDTQTPKQKLLRRELYELFDQNAEGMAFESPQLSKDTETNEYIGFPGEPIDPCFIDHIVGKANKEDKVELINILSGEVFLANPRPTMLLIRIFDDQQAFYFTEASGYAIGYDFLTDNIVIKYYFSDGKHRPLDNSWFTKPAADGVNFLGTPSALARLIGSRKGLDRAKSDYGFALVIRVVVGRWIVGHLEALKKVHDRGHGDLLNDDAVRKLTEVITVHRKELIDLPFPQKEKTFKDSRAKNSLPYIYTLFFLNDIEWRLREAALGAKKDGDAKDAYNMVTFYDGIKDAAKILSKDPGADPSKWGSWTK